MGVKGNGILYDSAGLPLAVAEDAAHISGQQGIAAIGVRKDTPATLAGTDGDNTLALYDASGRLWTNPEVEGRAAEDAAISGNPVLIGGESPTGTAKPIQTDANGNIPTVLQDDAGNTNTQVKGNDQGVLYVRRIGQGAVQENCLPLSLQKASVGTTATQLTTKNYLVREGMVSSDLGNTDANMFIGDAARADVEVWKAASGVAPTPIGPGLLKHVYVRTATTVADDAGFFGRLVDRPDFRELLTASIRANGGAYLPLEEMSGTAIGDLGKDERDFLLSGATLGDAGIFGRGVDFDGSNDYLRQKIEQAQSGTVSGVETDDAAELDDSGAVFTAAIRDGAHWVRVVDNGGDIVHGYIGTADTDGDDTRVAIFNDAARGTQSWVEGGATAFDMADTPLTYTVFKELARAATGLTLGCWINADDFGAGDDVLLSDLETSGGTDEQKGFLFGTKNGFAKLKVSLGATQFAATGVTPLAVGRDYLLVAEFLSSTSVTVYVNGVQDGQSLASIPALLNEARSPVSVGAMTTQASPGALANGRISHPFIIEAAMGANWNESLYAFSRR